jgi:hypothetical protein
MSELARQAIGPAVAGELEVERGVATVELVAHHGMPQPKSMGANLVLASGVWLDAGKGEAPGTGEWLEEGRGWRTIRAHGGAYGDLAGLVGPEWLFDQGGFGELALEKGEVGLVDPATFHSGLRDGGGAGMLGEEDDATGLAVEAADEVGRGHTAPLTDCAYERGPGSILGGMAYDPAGLVKDEEVFVLLDQPGPNLGG